MRASMGVRRAWVDLHVGVQPFPYVCVQIHKRGAWQFFARTGPMHMGLVACICVWPRSHVGISPGLC